MTDFTKKAAWFLARFMWMPISTAPQNKKLLVTYQPYGRRLVVMATYYAEFTLDASDDHETEDGYAPADWYEEAYENENLHCLAKGPTHWRRVPRAPRPGSNAHGGTSRDPGGAA